MMKSIEANQKNKRTFWQLVFAQSKVNGAPYYGEELQGRNWNWPKDTFLQRRLRQMRWQQTIQRGDLN